MNISIALSPAALGVAKGGCKKMLWYAFSGEVLTKAGNNTKLSLSISLKQSDGGFPAHQVSLNGMPKPWENGAVGEVLL